MPQDTSALKSLIVFPKCCWFYAWEHPQRNILEETFGNYDHGPEPGPRAVLVSQNATGWQVMTSGQNWILQFVWNILVFVCLEAQLLKEKGHFLWLIPIHLAPWVHTLCSGPNYYSGKGQYVSCTRKELSGLVPCDTMKINFHADSDLLQSCKTIYYWHQIVKPVFYFSLVDSSLFTCVCACCTSQTLLQYRSQQHNNGEFIKWQIALCYNNSFKS